MVPSRFEYVFILSLYALTGLSLCWDGLRVALRRRHFLPAIGVFFSYCAAIEIIAIHLGWWAFDQRRVIGIYIWRVPVEEISLFLIFAVLTLAAWESLAHDRS